MDHATYRKKCAPGLGMRKLRYLLGNITFEFVGSQMWRAQGWVQRNPGTAVGDAVGAFEHEVVIARLVGVSGEVLATRHVRDARGGWHINTSHLSSQRDTCGAELARRVLCPKAKSTLWWNMQYHDRKDETTSAHQTRVRCDVGDETMGPSDWTVSAEEETA